MSFPHFCHTDSLPIPLRRGWMNDRVGAWLLGRVDSPQLLIVLYYCQAQHKWGMRVGHSPWNWILMYLRFMFLNQLKFCIFCETRNSDRNSKIQKVLEDCRLWSSAVFGISQCIGSLRTGALMTRWNKCSQGLNPEGKTTHCTMGTMIHNQIRK